MKHLIAIVLLLLAFTPHAKAVPAAKSYEDCYAVGDMTIVAQTLHNYGIERSKARSMMLDIYAGTLEAIPKAKEWLEATLRLAERPQVGDPIPPAKLGELVTITCVRSNGDLTPVFGTGA